MIPAAGPGLRGGKTGGGSEGGWTGGGPWVVGLRGAVGGGSTVQWSEC